MTYLLTQIFICLLLAAVVGAVAAWLLRRNIAIQRQDVIQQHWKERIRQVEVDRDRSVQRLTAENDQLKKAGSVAGKSVALADYDNLATKLESQVAEREGVIAELRSEVQTLRVELTEALASAREREAGLLERHEQETANLMAQVEQSGHEALSEHEKALREQYEQQIAELTARLSKKQSAASADREAELHRQYKQQLSDLEDRLAKDHNRALVEKEEELQRKHEQAIAVLDAQWTRRHSDDSGQQLSAIQQQHEQEIANLKKQLAGQKSAEVSERALREQHEQALAGLEAQLAAVKDSKSDESDSALRRQHEQELASRTAQLLQQKNQALNEQGFTLREQFEKEIAGLKSELATLQSEDHGGIVEALRKQHEQQIEELQAQHEQQQSKALSELVTSLREEHDQEIAGLQAELQRHDGNAAPGADESQINDLLAEIRQRDDSIAVLRDDLAELQSQRKTDQRGRQDEQLRAAINDAVAWQEKYTAAAAELSRLTAAKTGASKPEPDVPAYLRASKSVSRKAAVSGGDRIGAVLSHPGGPNDRLQEIKGIGPVLERKLNDFGIYHFKQIAQFDEGDIARISNELGRFADRITRDDWIGQARILHEKYHG